MQSSLDSRVVGVAYQQTIEINPTKRRNPKIMSYKEEEKSCSDCMGHHIKDVGGGGGGGGGGKPPPPPPPPVFEVHSS